MQTTRPSRKNVRLGVRLLAATPAAAIPQQRTSTDDWLHAAGRCLGHTPDVPSRKQMNWEGREHGEGAHDAARERRPSLFARARQLVTPPRSVTAQ